MTDKIHLEYINAVEMRVVADAHLIMELSEHFTYFAENYKYHPKYKARCWDGKIRLLSTMTRRIYAGLFSEVEEFCKDRGYEFSCDLEFQPKEINREIILDFIKTLNLPDWLEVRDYQIDSIVECIRYGRRTLKSPTSSGKSWIIYILMRWYSEKESAKALIIVPTTSLVAQMESDFREYGWEGSVALSIDKFDRKDYDIDAECVISTWQTLDNGRTKMDKAWYQQFNFCVGDECHHAKATALIRILSNLVDCEFRFGTTGTLDGIELNQKTIYGLFGPEYISTTTRELIDDGHATEIEILCLVLDYPDEIKKQAKGLTYQDEVKFITELDMRQNYLTKMTKKIKGNKLIFFRFRDHGQKIKDSFDEAGLKNYYIVGGVKVEEREEIRKAIEGEDDVSLIASLGTTSTGVNIKKLKWMIPKHPSKGQIKVLQSIGRMLRQHKDIDKVYVIDVVDNLTKGKGKKNHLLNHFEHRLKIYDAEKFKYTIKVVKVK